MLALLKSSIGHSADETLLVDEPSRADLQRLFEADLNAFTGRSGFACVEDDAPPNHWDR